MWVPPSQLPDNSAGTSYYWYIRPCKTDGKCNPDPVSVANSATNAFRKVSPTVQLVSPGNGSEQSDDVRFDWTDYYLTNQGTSYVGTRGQPGTAPSYQTANVYHLQVSQSPVFSSLVVDANIDQTTFTSVDPTLPEGTLYWRVQVYDANMNGLQWSPVWTLTKRSGQTSLSRRSTARSWAALLPCGGHRRTSPRSTASRCTPMTTLPSHPSTGCSRW